MPKKLYEVKLRPEEHTELEALTRKGEVQVRVFQRARILLLVDEGLKDAEVMAQVGVSRATVSRIRRRYGIEGLAAVREKPRPGRPHSFDGEVRAKLTALACSTRPQAVPAGTCACWRTKRSSWVMSKPSHTSQSAKC